jgi:hypothetical protein
MNKSIIRWKKFFFKLDLSFLWSQNRLHLNWQFRKPSELFSLFLNDSSVWISFYINQRIINNSFSISEPRYDWSVLLASDWFFSYKFFIIYQPINSFLLKIQIWSHCIIVICFWVIFFAKLYLSDNGKSIIPLENTNQLTSYEI